MSKSWIDTNSQAQEIWARKYLIKKKAVGELETSNLLYRPKVKTSLGANSFEYRLINYPEDIEFIRGELSTAIRDFLFNQRAGKGGKLTASQRILMVGILALEGNFGPIIAFQYLNLSRLTGIPHRNISSNLLKLDAKGYLSALEGKIKRVNDNKLVLAYLPNKKNRKSGPNIVINDKRPTEIQVISVLTHKKEIEEYLQKSTDMKDILSKFYWYELEKSKLKRCLYEPFISVPERVRTPLLRDIEQSTDLWRKLEKSNLLDAIEVVVCSTALKIISMSNCGGYSYPYDFIEHPEIRIMIKDQLRGFPISFNQQENLIDIIIPLSCMMAQKLANITRTGGRGIDITGGNLSLMAFYPYLDLLINDSGFEPDVVIAARYENYTE
ncbi:hypothetical protein ACQKPX_22610 [Photobacterium sp. DNB23_23_1]